MKGSPLSKTILIFSAQYLPHVGGVEVYTASLAKEIEKMGHHAIIVTNNLSSLAEHETLDFGAEIYRLPCVSFVNGRLPFPKYNKHRRQLLQELKTREKDYVVINTRFYPHTFTGARIAENANIKPIVIDHGSAYLTLGNKVLDTAVKAYEHIITYFLKKHPIDFYAVSQKSLKWLTTFHVNGKGVLSNSIDANLFSSQSSKRNFRSELNIKNTDFVVSFIGRFIPEKGIVSLMEAAKKLRDHADIAFLFAGDGSLAKEIENYNVDNVHLLGRLNSADVAALLETSDCFCLPSRSEGFSTSLLEAAACKTTSIITRVGGVDELIPTNDYGIVLSNTSPETISEAILMLHDNQELNKTMAANIYQKVVNEFSWAATTEKVLDACKQANQTKNPNVTS